VPWTAGDATKHTKKASSARLRALWASAANSALSSGNSEGSAVRIGNAAVIRALSKRR